MIRCRVLQIDDSLVDCQVLRRRLPDDIGLDWREDLKSGKAAFENSFYDLVVLDLLLPGTSGVETLREWLRICPKAVDKTVVLTGSDTEDVAEACIKAGAKAVEMKTVDCKRIGFRIAAMARDILRQSIEEIDADLKRLKKTVSA